MGLDVYKNVLQFSLILQGLSLISEDILRILSKSQKKIQSWIVDEKEVDTQGDFHVIVHRSVTHNIQK